MRSSVETPLRLSGSDEVMSASLLIIVPTLDSYELLSGLVESLQAQTWTAWRLLFIDGPSSPAHRHWLCACCESENRCTWMEQSPDHRGIFGAMTQGFQMAGPDDWLLFWGSDDWAAADDVLQQLIASISMEDFGQSGPDLVVCRGRYADWHGNLGRRCAFGLHASKGVNPAPAHDLDAAAFRRRLFLGATPPHQSTLFCPKAIQRLSSYRDGLRLTADLDYFLRLSRLEPLKVRLLDLELVHMGDTGVSGQQTRRRLREVKCSYRQAFGWRWWIPFVARYLRRLASRFFVL